MHKLHSMLGAALLACGLAACKPLEDESGGALLDAADDGTRGASASNGTLVVNVRGLLGRGMIIQLPDGSMMALDKDGQFETTVPVDEDSAQLMVVEGPASPHQVCDVGRAGANAVLVYCSEKRWQIGGTLTGLVGRGLVIGVDNIVPEDIKLDADGEFAFTRALQDDTDYDVVVRTQPTAPRQTCTVENGAGFADGFDIDDVRIICKTDMYQITANVVGLEGSGLTLALGDELPIAIERSGSYVASDTVADGTMVSARIVTQPQNPTQRCHVQLESPVVDGSDTSISVTCGAGGKLRVSEVGACPFTTSSCWFEIYNISDFSEQLGYYTLRTGAIAPDGTRSASRSFDLPYATVPGQSFVLVQGATASAMADGSNVVHVADGDVVPFWTADGFIELIDHNGATTDFMRFGKSTDEPTTGGTWIGGSAPALPTGIDSYGQSVTHIPRTVTFSSGSDWYSSKFATYAGNNDIAIDEDNDDDGIPDVAELSGGTFAGVDLYKMGARVGQRDVFVEIDYMTSEDPAVSPRREALDSVVSAFARHGIVLHFDVGGLFSRTFSPSDYNLGGGTAVPFAQAVGIGYRVAGWADLYDYKAVYMEGRRRSMFHYMLFGSSQRLDDEKGPSGSGEVRGNDSVITLGGNGLNADSLEQTNRLINYQAATIMHELGHNLGLRHGGADEINYKPNYLSVMNYLYSPYGLATIGNSEGDRYYLYAGCAGATLGSLVSSPLGPINRFRLDFSDGFGSELDEGYVDERVGLGRSNSGLVDYDCNGRTNVGYRRDLNNDGKFDVLSDTNDWLKIRLPFTRVLAGASGSTPLDSDPDGPHDYLSGDRGANVSDETEAH